MLHTIKFIGILTIVSLLASCMEIKPSVFDDQKLMEINIWRVGFTYEPGEIEEKAGNNGQKEIRQTKRGHSDRALLFIDDVFFCLKGVYKIPVTKNEVEGAGSIKIHPLYSYYAYRVIDVTFYPPNDEVIARIRVKNVDNIRDEPLAHQVAKAIANLIKTNHSEI